MATSLELYFYMLIAATIKKLKVCIAASKPWTSSETRPLRHSNLDHEPLVSLIAGYYLPRPNFIQ